MGRVCIRRILLTALALVLGTANGAGVIPSTRNGAYTIGPNYTADPAIEPCSSCARGHVFHFNMPIAGTAYDCDLEANPVLSPKCFPFCGQKFGPPGTRNITVYVPAAYKDGDEAGVMVMQDGQLALGVANTFDTITNIMDNLIGAEDSERSLPTFVLVAVQLAGPGQLDPDCGGGPGTERVNEYATVSGKYARFVSQEVISFVVDQPEIKSRFPNFAITEDPAGRATYGCSKGGGAAFTMAFFEPSLFGISIGYSAALTKIPGTPLDSDVEYPLGNAEYWVHPSPTLSGQELIEAEPSKPIRVFHSAGEWDFGTPKSCNPDGSPNPFLPEWLYANFLEGNNQVEAALVAKGYQTRYAYGLGACHCEFALTYQDLPNTLVWSWAEWKKQHVAEDKSPSSSSSSSCTDSVTGEPCTPPQPQPQPQLRRLRRLLFGGAPPVSETETCVCK